ncbi:MAG: FAD-binding oxidoreductase [Clostridia bacterium]|nr:FAD-binding oxidoreductase [Clostridia bacterium]
MNLVSGKLLWTNTSPIPYKYMYLSEDIECEIAVVGAGVIGAICAYYLTEAGIQTVLVDKNIIGYGSTSASTSILQYEVDTDLIGLKGLIGIENALRSFKLNEKAVNDIKEIIDRLRNKCDFILRECFYYTANPADEEFMQNEYTLRKENGFDVEFLDSEAATRRFSFKVQAGIYSNSGAAEINPYRFAHELIRSSVAKGLQVFENTEITYIEHTADSLLLETKNGKKIKCKKIVVATGYEATRYMKRRIAGINRTFTIVTKPVASFEGWHRRCILRDNNNPYTYLRTTLDNRIIIGGEDVKIGGINSKMSTLRNTDNFLNEKYNILENRLKSMFPAIHDIEIEYKFTGLFADTKDSLPFIGPHRHFPNHYFCLCYGSNGILYGILGGQLIRDLYLGKKPSEQGLFRFDRR